MGASLHHVGLSVRDMDRALAQWTGLTGFASGARRTFDPDVCEGAGLGPMSMEAVHLAGGTAPLELVSVRSGGSLQPALPTVATAGITHACVQAPRDTGRFERLLDAGLRPHSVAPVLLPTGIHYAYARDDEENVVELEQLGPDRLGSAPAVVREHPVWLGHVGICTADIDRATDFWGRALDEEPLARAAFGPMPALDEITGLPGIRTRWTSWLRTGVFGLELWQYDEPRTTAQRGPRSPASLGWHHVALACTDLAAERDRLVGLGASFPAVGGAPVLFGHDPDGNLIELLVHPDQHDPENRPAEEAPA
jgi:catechol 2,3-dioxygenase-like lactoylglutathione lyase family enzyme